MAMTLCELKWLRQLLTDLHISVQDSIPLHCDSQAALYIAANPVFHERTKYNEIDCHYIRDVFQAGLITSAYIPSVSQLTDVLTKALYLPQFRKLLDKLGICNLHAST